MSLLTLAYVFSFVDRYILGLLIEPIKADLHFSDEKIGYLLGPAFALFYATIVSLYYMMISVAGLGLWPTTVGLLSTRVFGEANLRAAVAAVPLIYGIIPLLLLPLIARAYRAQLARTA